MVGETAQRGARVSKLLDQPQRQQASHHDNSEQADDQQAQLEPFAVLPTAHLKARWWHLVVQSLRGSQCVDEC